MSSWPSDADRLCITLTSQRYAHLYMPVRLLLRYMMEDLIKVIPAVQQSLFISDVIGRGYARLINA